ncbi:winged helix-turn-helix transcriptional regulator [Crossiella equi]|uniref:winged helix-turn-helix transcriptional regulator n=1 Tax=Crossiella equi TaxID=130796 RepID=UPI0011779465
MVDHPRWAEIAERVRLLSGDWAVPVLAALSEGPLRYTELLQGIREAGKEAGIPPGGRILHSGTLTATLKTLEGRGLISRDERRREVPPEVVYELTDAAWTLIRASG